MQRRDFIAGLGLAAAWPLAARAQQPAVPAIGLLGVETPTLQARQLSGFHRGLSETGYVEGKNLTIEYRWAEGHFDRLPSLAEDLIRHRVAVIATSGSGSFAAKAATTVLPIVAFVAVDPVKRGLVASLNRPGGNFTGVVSLNVELVSKRLEMMHELVPKGAKIAVLVYPGVGTQIEETVQAAAGTIGRELQILHASTETELDAALADVARLGAAGLVVANNQFFNVRHEQIATLSLRYSVPTIFQYSTFAEAGGLMSYGGSNPDGWHLVGVYTGRILKGEKPSDLPVQQEARIQLIINLKTAKALGLTIPETLLATADRVIE